MLFRSGMISMHSIPSASATPAPYHASINGSPHHSRLPSLPKEDSLQEQMAKAAAGSESVTQGEGAKMKTVDMFRVPESPINDIEGLGAASGGG